MEKPTIRLTPTGGGNRLTLDEIEELASGRANLTIRYTKDYKTPRSVKLTPTERAAFERAKREGWYYKTSKKVALLAHYWHETSKSQDVEIQKRTKTSDVTLDAYNMGRKIDGKWCDACPPHVEKLAARFGGKVIHVGTVTSIRVPTEVAEKCAKALKELFDRVASE